MSEILWPTEMGVAIDNIDVNEKHLVIWAHGYHWSNGPVEGQVNRLKLFKRNRYGRAKFDLLGKHVVGMPVTG